MQLIPKDYSEGDYEKYVQKLTKDNMQNLFEENFGGWSDEVSEKKFFEVLKNGNVKLFFLEGDFVGYVSYEIEKNNSNSYLIHDIHILKKFQQKGFGSEILKYVVEQTKEKQLKVFVFENNEAIKFYLKYGFEKNEFLEKSKTWVLIRNYVSHQIL